MDCKELKGTMETNDYDDFDEDDDEEDEEEEEEVAAPKKRGKKWKDPNKPKRNMSAFFLFSQVNRPRVKEENPEVSFGQVAKILAREFRELSDEERAKWNDKAAREKIRYQEQMRDYVPPEDPSGPSGGGRKKQKRNPDAPKRNMSSYFLYSVHIRPTVKEENPGASFGEIARIISSQFKALSPAEKAIWDERAAADKERYQREMADYEE